MSMFKYRDKDVPPTGKPIGTRMSRLPGYGEGNPLACAYGMRGPKPYGNPGRFFIVARGPVPRERGMARDRPSPYGNPGRFFSPSRGGLSPASVVS